MKNLLKSTLIMTSIGMLIGCTPPAEVKEEMPPSNKIVTDHIKVWNEAINQVMELADAMPEDMYSYRPHDSVRTFAEQLVHIGGSSAVICNLYLKDIPPPSEMPDMDIASMSKEEIKGFVKGQMMAVADSMATLNDLQLAEEITSFGGNKMSRLEGLLTVHDHMTNHKAKANLYVRISGNTPPSYRYY